jgi:hypothetical protein
MTMLSLPQIKFRYEDSNGNPLANGKVYTYVSGTSTLLTTYTDAAGGTPNTNPVILDSRGEADIWLQPGKKYRITVKDSNDATVETSDGIVGVGAIVNSGTATLTTGSVTVNNTSITASSRIIFSIQSVSGTPGIQYISSKTAGVGFVVTSTSATDGSTIAYTIVEP